MEEKESGSSRVDPNLLRPEVACVIGHIAIHWSKLEDLISGLIQILLSLQDDAAVVVYADTSSLQKANIFGALIVLTEDQGLIEECDTLMAEYNRLRAIRNDIFHGLWSVHEQDYLVYRFASQGLARLKPAIVTFQSLRETFTAILNLINLLFNYSDRLAQKEAAVIIARPRKGPFPPRPPSKSAQDQVRSRQQKIARRNHNRESATSKTAEFAPDGLTKKGRTSRNVP